MITEFHSNDVMNLIRMAYRLLLTEQHNIYTGSVRFGVGKLLNNTSRGSLRLWQLGRRNIWLQHRGDLALVHCWPRGLGSIVLFHLQSLVQVLSPKGVMRRRREVIGSGQAVDLLLW